MRVVIKNENWRFGPNPAAPDYRDSQDASPVISASKRRMKQARNADETAETRETIQNSEV